MQVFAPFRSVRRYMGKIKTIRDEIRTERLMNSLPEELRRDIGWPERLPDRHSRRR